MVTFGALALSLSACLLHPAVSKDIVQASRSVSFVGVSFMCTPEQLL